MVLLLVALPAYSLKVKGFMPDRKTVYKTVGDTELKLHVFIPEGHKSSDRRPAIVFFFGFGHQGLNQRGPSMTTTPPL